MKAPVVLFVYNRVEHAKKVLSALDRNYDADETNLYIFSDAAKNESESENVRQVRKYIKHFAEGNHFQNTTIIEAVTNKGLAKSIIDGVTDIINQYGKVIVLEDDHLTSPDFIRYMNQGLDFYEKNPKIWSISGYTWNMKSFRRYKHDIFMGYRASCWGWASWKDRWEKVDWYVSDYNEFMTDSARKRRFNRGGMDMVNLLKMQQNGEINSWAIRWCFQQYKEGMLSVFPVHSKVKNIGLDGSGTHSGNVNAFQTDVQKDENIKFENISTYWPISLEFWVYCTKLYLRQLLGKYWYFLTEYEYCILYHPAEHKQILENVDFQVLKPTFRYWYAEPIPFTFENKDYVFMEVFDKRKGKGFIGVSEFDESGKMLPPKKVLEENFHLSFPYIFRYKDSVFMMPECSACGEIRIYKMGQDVYEWEIFRSFSGIANAVDTITFQHDNERVYLLSSLENPVNKYQTKQVIFCVTGLETEKNAEAEEVWRDEDYSYDVRNAGGLVTLGDRIYRPVQHSTAKEYGKFITFHEVSGMDSSGLRENVVKKVGIGDIRSNLPPFIYRIWGTHTYGQSERIEVMDLSVQRFSLAGLFYKVWRRVKRQG